MKKTNIKLALLAIISVLINIRIPILANMKPVDTAYDYMQIVFFFIVVPIALCKGRLTKRVLFLLGFYGVYIFTTIINSGNLSTIIKYIPQAANIMLSFQLVKDESKIAYLKLMSGIMTIMISLNLLAILLFPSGLYTPGTNPNPHYILGHRNDIVEYIFPWLTMAIATLVEQKNKKRHLIPFLLISTITIVLTWSANALVAIALTIALLFMNNQNKSITVLKLVYGYLITFFAIIVFRLQNSLSWLIEGMLHKTLTFTGRTEIWDKSLSAISELPIFGYGYKAMDEKRELIGHVNSCHNYLLDFLFYGGFMMVSYIAGVLLLINKSINVNYRKNKDFIAIMAGYIVVWFATPIHLATIHLMLFAFLIIITVSKSTKKRE